MDKAVSAGEMILLCRLCVSPKSKQRSTPEGQLNGSAKKGRVKEGGRGGEGSTAHRTDLQRRAAHCLASESDPS